MKRILILFILTVVVCIFGGCETNQVIKRENFTPRGKRMAVFAGSRTKANIVLAENLTESLKKMSMFTVISQQEIKEKIPYYPTRIQGPWTLAYYNIDVDTGKSDRERISAYQKAVGADYIAVIWSPLEYTNTMENQFGTVLYRSDSIHGIVQIFEFPGCQDIGNKQFTVSITMTKNALTYLAGNKSKEQLLAEWGDGMAKRVAREMKMAKVQ